jgi:hypothetical protein
VAQVYKVVGQKYTSNVSRTVTNKEVSDNTVTLTTSVDHNIVVGQAVTVAEDAQQKAVTLKALTSNVATLTIGTHRITVGQTINVNITDAVFDGVHTVTATTPTTVSYSKTASNVTQTSDTGTVTYLDLSFNGSFVVDSNPTTTTFTYTRVCDDLASAATSEITATHIPWQVVTVCPADTSIVISSLMICNQSFGTGQYQVAVSNSLDFENKNIIFYNDTLSSSDTITITSGIVLDSVNKYLLVAADIEGVSCSAFGVEVS